MPAPLMMAGAAIAAPIVGGLMGNIMSAGDRRQAKQMMKKAYAELKKVGLPPDLSGPLILQEFQKAGMLTPELEEDLQLSRSEFESIQEDPSLRETQLEALNKFRQQAQGGIQADERAALNQIQRENAQAVQAQREQILMDQQRRGMGGSGNELIAQLQASQAGADQASQQGDALMKLIAERVRSGANDMANLGGQMRDQDYQRARDRAAAIDARNQFQYTNSMSRQSRNTDRVNQANAANLDNAQSIRNANTTLRNNEQLRQRNEQGNYWDKKMQYGSALANARLGQASQYNAQADRTAGMYSGIGQGVGQGLSAYAKMSGGGAKSGYGGDEASNEYDDYYMNEVD